MNEGLRHKRILAILLVLLMLLGGAGAIVSVTDAKEGDGTDPEMEVVGGVEDVASGHDTAIAQATDDDRG
ncbi:hypothetical protein [Haladaptatus caseinilyticus]|uniref:hypothetical protein n=1 Tax=Haladaptatus caseinilyticus TaxID=2993314 RepID=UPI00224B584A|nr:hypothetical protein [Haladaptatus caseinilyticus]